MTSTGPEQPVGAPVPDWRGAELPDDRPMLGQACRVVRLDPAEHGASLFEADSADAEGRLWTYLADGPFETADDHRAWLDAVAAREDPFFYAIVDQRTSRAVGMASYLRIEPAAGSIEVGNIRFSPRLQRTTAATEAMFLMMERAFELGYRRYEWKCDSLNAPSRAAALRLGFRFEGVFRQALVYKGRNRDTAWYSIIDSEWPALRAAYREWLAPSNFDADGAQLQRLSELTARAGTDPSSR